MKCLHICNDFSLTKVHRNLYSCLDELELNQIIYNPIRSSTPIGNNKIDFNKENDSEIIYSKMLKRRHKILFRKKIKFLFNDLESKYDLKNIDIIHATTLFSDGALAYQIYKKYKIPYIVAVRGTDLNLYLKYRPDLYFYLKKILVNASKLIFLSSAIKKQFLSNKSIQLTKVDVNNKSKVINNAIDAFWLKNLKDKKITVSPFKILYVGRFDKNKNTLKLIKAVLKLKSRFNNLEINLVGKGGEYENKIIELAKLHKGTINYHGSIYDKHELRNIYFANHIFAMPSHGETFGLVYLEALSQGLPILCSKNQGVDGSFKNKIGEFVNPKTIDSIALGLKDIIDHYGEYEPNKIDFNTFDWKIVAKNYNNLYNETINK